MFTKNSTIGEIIAGGQKNVEILMNLGMHCCGCPMSQNETLEQACAVHGIDIEFVLNELNK